MKNNSHNRQNKNKNNTYWLYGKHAVIAALRNPKRKCMQLITTQNTYNDCIKAIESTFKKENTDLSVKVVNSPEINNKFSPDTTTQGIAMLVYSLPDIKIEQLGLHKSTKPIVILDQISDPHNVGAIMRTAAAFNAAAIIIAKNNAPDESANIAKIACGTMEITPIIKVVNITKTMEQIKEYGYWCIGLDGHAKQSISSSNLPDKLALVLGSEGKGIRKLVKQTCDLLVTIPMNPNVESLNVSNAAAISLYEISRNKDPAH